VAGGEALVTPLEANVLMQPVADIDTEPPLLAGIAADAIIAVFVVLKVSGAFVSGGGSAAAHLGLLFTF
jgi:hypothetical protein